MRQKVSLGLFSFVCLNETHILKQSVMFQTCLLSAKKQRLELAYRHCEREKKILHPHAISPPVDLFNKLDF